MRIDKNIHPRVPKKMIRIIPQNAEKIFQNISQIFSEAFTIK